MLIDSLLLSADSYGYLERWNHRNGREPRNESTDPINAKMSCMTAALQAYTSRMNPRNTTVSENTDDRIRNANLNKNDPSKLWERGGLRNQKSFGAPTRKKENERAAVRDYQTAPACWTPA